MINFPFISKLFSPADKHPALPAVGLWLRASWAPGRIAFLDSWVCRLWIFAESDLRGFWKYMWPLYPLLRKTAALKAERRENGLWKMISETVPAALRSTRKSAVSTKLKNAFIQSCSFITVTRNNTFNSNWTTHNPLQRVMCARSLKLHLPGQFWQANRLTLRNNRSCFC